MIEEDTSDETFKGTPHATHDRNIEFKTVGGFNEGEIVHVSGDIQRLLNFFRSYAIPTLEIHAAKLSELLKGLEVKSDPRNPPMVSIKSKIEDKTVRPQITYQLPIFLLPQVFERLGALGHTKINDFLDCLNPDIPADLNEEEIAKRLASVSLMRKNVGHDKKVQLFLKSTLGPVIAHLEPSNARSFCYLILYYWYSIFNNKENTSDSSEPGPKKSLAILSRAPISQLFDTLDDANKAIVRGILDPIIGSYGTSFKITAYSDYDGDTISPPLTLKDWYESVVDPSHRREVEGRHVDLLSPPPGLENTGYSMGYLDVGRDSSGFSLLEVRGYASLKWEGKPLEISAIQKLVSTEAHWFFNILGG